MYFNRVKSLLSYDYIYLIPLFLSAVVSVNSFRLKWSWGFRLFSSLLLTTVFVEVFAISWKWGMYKGPFWDFSPSNLWIYNAFLIPRHLCTVLFFFSVQNSSAIKKILLLSLPLFIIFSIVNYFFIQTPFSVNTYTVVLSNSIIIMTVLLFFKQVIDEERVINLVKASEIWIALGTLVYYTGTLPFFVLFNTIIESNSPLLMPLLYINDGLNVLMYSLYLTAFLCSPQTQK